MINRLMRKEDIRGIWQELLCFLLTFFMASAAHADKGIGEIERALEKIVPMLKPSAIEASPIEGVYLVTTGQNAFYVTKKENFLVMGDIYDLDGQVSLLSERVKSIRLEAIDSIPQGQRVTFPAENPTKVITVFTDVDCEFCKHFHEKDRPLLNSKGVSVDYLFYPGAGVPSESYRKLVAIWCSADRRAALTKVKKGQEIALKVKECANPVAAHYSLGQDLGIRGTPWIVLDDGDLIPHYATADRLLEEIFLH